MKKIIFMLFVTIASAIAITSCTEENVQPTQDNEGGGATDPKTP